MNKWLTLFIAFSLQSAAVKAETFISQDDYETTLTFLLSSVEDHGLVISNRNFVNSMLKRTSEDVGADTQIYENADIVGFCSATLSYEAMKADITSIQHCPYNIYIYQAKGEDDVILGYRDLPDTPELNAVEELLKSIILSTIE